MTNASVMVLSLLSGLTVIWFLLEQTILDRYVRYVQMVYIVLMVALAAIVTKHVRTEEPLVTRAFSTALLAVVGLLQISRVFLTCAFACCRPINFLNRNTL